MWVKICGNTNLEDALAAAKLGADALGFVFAPSVRRVSVETVAGISLRLPPEVLRVGVFLDEPVDGIVRAVATAKLNGVQLHGSYDVETVEALRRDLPAEMTILQAVHWKVDGAHSAVKVRAEIERIQSEGQVDRILVDSKVRAASGGTGVAFDWSAAAEFFSEYGLVLAGGLNPENVGNAVEALKPWGVDVASGVEEKPGLKDHAKLREFIRTARQGAG